MDTFAKITGGKKMHLGFSVLTFIIIIGKRWEHYFTWNKKVNELKKK